MPSGHGASAMPEGHRSREAGANFYSRAAGRSLKHKLFSSHKIFI